MSDRLLPALPLAAVALFRSQITIGIEVILARRCDIEISGLHSTVARFDPQSIMHHLGSSLATRTYVGPVYSWFTLCTGSWSQRSLDLTMYKFID